MQKKFYKWLYNRTYDDGNLETAFPENVEKDLSKFPKCQANIKKLFCGELFPPCFPDEESPVFKTLCSSVCNDIIRDCPAYFRYDPGIASVQLPLLLLVFKFRDHLIIFHIIPVPLLRCTDRYRQIVLDILSEPLHGLEFHQEHFKILYTMN